LESNEDLPVISAVDVAIAQAGQIELVNPMLASAIVGTEEKELKRGQDNIVVPCRIGSG
jgi:hypothetical protein